MIIFLLLEMKSWFHIKSEKEEKMAIKIVIKRHFKENTAEEAFGLLNNFRQYNTICSTQ